jgi:quercetin dioxygenase-like cupin family protein
MKIGITVGTVVGVIVIGLAAMLAAAQQVGAPPPGITRTELLNNATVLVARLRMAPGAREDVHTHPFSAVVVQIDAGDVDMRLGDARSTTRRGNGFIEFIPTDVPHAAANVGQEPFEVVTIAMKSDRRPGGDAPASTAPPGIIRQPLLENPETRVAHVTFAPSAREPVHTHPFDLVVVQLTAGRVEVRVAEQVSVRDYEPGEVMFLPRDVPHAVSNVGRGQVEILSVGIK